MPVKIRPRTNQTFCIYCQVEHHTPRRLVRHIVNEHPRTHAEYNLVEYL